jgi:nucleoside phosphorylase
VVSQPYGTFAGVVQYDAGKATPSGFDRTGALNAPPQILLAAVAQMQAKKYRNNSKLREYITKLESISIFQRNKAGLDILFEATYEHEDRRQMCDKCNVDRQKPRRLRDSDEDVTIHYGTIASANHEMQSAVARDKVSDDLGGVLCFEMEAAGLMNNFPCLVIRGISNYADTHKNQRWQAYAAGTAAAYVKELLSVIPVEKIAETPTAEEAIKESVG